MPSVRFRYPARRGSDSESATGGFAWTGYPSRMDAERHRLLGIYLNDHFGGSTGGVEMARRARDANDGTEFGAPLATVCREIEEDRDTLESVMEELGIDRSRIKP